MPSFFKEKKTGYGVRVEGMPAALLGGKTAGLGCAVAENHEQP